MKTKQIPFDANRIGELKVVTRDGREVKDIYWFKNSDDKQPVLAMIDKFVHAFSENGRYYSDITHSNDLFMLEEVKMIEGWVNVYRSGATTYTGICIYLSKEMADKEANENTIACIKVSFYEGEGL